MEKDAGYGQQHGGKKPEGDCEDKRRSVPKGDAYVESERPCQKVTIMWKVRARVPEGDPCVGKQARVVSKDKEPPRKRRERRKTISGG